MSQLVQLEGKDTTQSANWALVNNLHFFQYIQAYKPFADPVPPNTKQYQLILTKYQPVSSYTDPVLSSTTYDLSSRKEHFSQQNNFPFTTHLMWKGSSKNPLKKGQKSLSISNKKSKISIDRDKRKRIVQGCSQSKHLKGQLGPRVCHVTFFGSK